MLVLIKNNVFHLQEEKGQISKNRLALFGQWWRRITYSPEDRELFEVWERKSKMCKINGKKVEDGIYVLSKGDLILVKKG